jgi:hypothetical protein
MVSDGGLMSAPDHPPFGFHVHNSTSLYVELLIGDFDYCDLGRQEWIMFHVQFLKYEYSYGLSLYHIITVEKLYSTSLVQCEQWNNLHDKSVVALLITRN